GQMSSKKAPAAAPVVVSRLLEDRLAKLEEVEKKVDQVLQFASNTLEEMGKDRTVQKTVDDHTKKFINSLREVEKDMLEQLTYLNQVSCGHPYESSAYAARLQSDQATEQAAIVANQLDDLIAICAQSANGSSGATAGGDLGTDFEMGAGSN
ncbi:hypothetical protein BOX15_Mlig015581g1, partial [Macrostomum lignano]